jgi:hypothetical protein
METALNMILLSKLMVNYIKFNVKLHLFMMMEYINLLQEVLKLELQVLMYEHIRKMILIFSQQSLKENVISFQ